MGTIEAKMPVRAIRRFAAVSLAASLLTVGEVPARAQPDPPADAPPSEARREKVVEDRYIVVYDPSVEAPGRVSDRLEKEVGFRTALRYDEAIEGFAARLTPTDVQKLRKHPRVELVTADRRVDAIGSVPMASGETAPNGIERIEASSGGSVHEASTENVAVIDTGIDLDHPDLNVAPGRDCTGTGSSDDDNGHGTHVAGTIGARNDGAGLVGVAPGTKLYAVKVLNRQGSGTDSGVICGIDWVTGRLSDGDPANDITVANMSLGGGGDPIQTCATTSDPMHQAICRSTSAGVTYVVAAGNDGWDFDYQQVPDTPAAYPEVLTVTAVSDSDGQGGGTGGSPTCRSGESDDRYASFSNFAATAAGRAHTVGGPGVCIVSTYPGGGNATMSGTSMASPHVAGLAALCLGEGGTPGPCAGLNPSTIIQTIRSQAETQTSSTPSYGFNGDPTRPVSGEYYGFLAWAEGASPSPTPSPTPSPSPSPIDLTPPTVTSFTPAEGATGIAPGTGVTVKFSEEMSRPSAEDAFSLTRDSDGVPAGGTFAWTETTMTFQPSAPLAEGASYTATMGTGAEDQAGNALADETTWSFGTLRNVTTPPGSTALLTGSVRSGNAGRLEADDNAYYEVSSNSSSTRTSDWYGAFPAVPNDLTELKVTYKGKNSRSCTQRLYVWNWATNAWVQLDSRSVSTTEVLVEKTPTGTLADYVSGASGDGELRVRLRCTTTSGTFFASADLLRIAYGARSVDSTAPNVSSLSPLNGAPGVSAGTAVNVTFSEHMDRPSAEASFSLASETGTPVAGTFSWSGTTMTFQPSALLAEGSSYTAHVGTGSKDLAGNRLAIEATSSFRTLRTVTASPGSATVTAGTIRSGTAARLEADDNAYLEVSSNSSSTRTSDWYGSFAAVPNDLSGLKVTYKGKNSRSCSQRLYIWNWSTSAWVQLDSRSVGTTEVLVEKAPSGTAANYVSGTSGPGDLRARVRCTNSSSTFVASGDLLRIVYSLP